MQIKGKGLMVTYWLLGEEMTRLESSTEAGIQFPSQCGRSTKRSLSMTHTKLSSCIIVFRFKRKSFVSARGEFRHMSRREKGRQRQRVAQTDID